MKFFKVPSLAKKYPIAFSIAVVLHIIILVLIIFYSTTPEWLPKVKKAEPQITQKSITKAVAVDFSLIKQERQRIINIGKQKQLKLEREQATLIKLKKEKSKLDKARKKANQKRIIAENAGKKANKKRIIAESKKTIAEHARKKAEAKKVLADKAIKKANKKRIIAERARKKAEAKKVLADKAIKKSEAKKVLADKAIKKANKKRIIAERARKKAEAKKLLAQKEAKQAQIATKKILAQKEKLTKAYIASAAKFKEDKIKFNLSREIAAEERRDNSFLIDKQLQVLKGDYINLIASKVKTNWRSSRNFEDKWQCQVLVRQTPAGAVKSVVVSSCNNTSEHFSRSIREAVYKADPLPKALVDEIFDEVISFDFIY